MHQVRDGTSSAQDETSIAASAITMRNAMIVKPLTPMAQESPVTVHNQFAAALWLKQAGGAETPRPYPFGLPGAKGL